MEKEVYKSSTSSMQRDNKLINMVYKMISKPPKSVLTKFVSKKEI